MSKTFYNKLKLLCMLLIVYLFLNHIIELLNLGCCFYIVQTYKNLRKKKTKIVNRNV